MNSEAPFKVQKDIIFIGKTNFRGRDRVFGIKTRDRRQHTYVIGKTGTGKTTLLENMALQDIHTGKGIGVIDPHGEFVERLLDQIPQSRMKDVVYVNPVDSEFPIGFNVLEVSDPKYKHLVVSDLLGIFTKIWAGVWSARMEYIMQNCILALIDTPGTTLLGIPRILVDKSYRESIVKNVMDPVVRSFWLHEYDQWEPRFRNEAIVPIQNKVGQFLNTGFIRNMVGQPVSTLKISEIMNQEKILLVNVSKGRIGEDNSQLLGAMIITKIQLAAMERVRIPEEDRRDFYLYVDEFQNFATDSFAGILSEARKYRLDLIIAHQYVGQLVTDVSTKVRDAVFGNVGTLMTFRIGASDAEFLEPEFEPEFHIEDLSNVPNHHIYLKLMVDGITSRPFSAVTLPPVKLEEEFGRKEEIISASRSVYARPAEEVEREIALWSGTAGAGGVAGQDAGNQKFDAICWNCGKQTTVPFKPDGKRPVYCLSCMKQIEEGKLIPLPERMPQVGQARFGASLGDVGIEFPAAAGSPVAERKFSRSLPQQTREFPRNVHETPPSPSRSLPSFRPMRAPSRGDQFRSSRPSDDHYLPRRRQPPMPGIHTVPVVRPGADAKKLSLSALRRADEDGIRSAPPEPDKKSRGVGSHPSVNVDELRKVLDEFLARPKDTRPQQGLKTSSPNNAGDGNGGEQHHILKPGDTVRL